LGITNDMQMSELSLFPNPADQEVNLRFTLPNASSLSVDICDLSGKIVSHSSINGATGINIVTIPTSTLASGAYQVHVHDGTNGKVLQMVVR
jgi:hypothetical protein